MLIYAAPSWDDITYREEIEVLKQELDLTVIYVLRKTHADWEGDTGYVEKGLLEKYIPIHRGSRHYFICAAPVMMDAVERALFELDVSVTNVHMEHFDLA